MRLSHQSFNKPQNALTSYVTEKSGAFETERMNQIYAPVCSTAPYIEVENGLFQQYICGNCCFWRFLTAENHSSDLKEVCVLEALGITSDNASGLFSERA